MLGEHIQMYKRRPKIETTSDFLTDVIPQKSGNYHETDFAPGYRAIRSFYGPAYLDIGEGITYIVLPTYENLATSVNLPSKLDIRVEEFYLTGALDLGSLTTMMAADKRFGPQTMMGDPKPQYHSLQAILKAQPANNSAQKFSLIISDIVLDKLSIPEGVAGKIQQSILSGGGVLQV